MLEKFNTKFERLGLIHDYKSQVDDLRDEIDEMGGLSKLIEEGLDSLSPEQMAIFRKKYKLK